MAAIRLSYWWSACVSGIVVRFGCAPAQKQRRERLRPLRVIAADASSERAFDFSVRFAPRRRGEPQDTAEPQDLTEPQDTTEPLPAVDDDHKAG